MTTDRNTEKAQHLEWQVAGNSNTLHLIDTSRPGRRSGARAECGRYPQRNFQPRIVLSLEDMEAWHRGHDVMWSHGLKQCFDCLRTLSAQPAASSSTPVSTAGEA